MAERDLAVEVVFAPRTGEPFVRRLLMPPGSCVRDAIKRSDLGTKHPEAAWQEPGNLGIFSRVVQPEHLLRDGDRVEVYRALTLTPMQARRLRAARR